MRAENANSLFLNGKIYTLEGKRRIAQALAVANGRIVAVGDNRTVRRDAPRGADKYDLAGRVVVPGFIDCHTHFIGMGVDSMTIDLSKTRTIEEALSLMKQGAERVPEGEWVVGVNWKESGWVDGRYITRADLDASCPGHPAVAHRVCGHLSSVNSRAVSMLGITKETADAEVSESGLPTGVLRESAVAIARAATAPDASRKAKGLALAIKRAHSQGVTSVTDNGDESHLSVYRAAESAGLLKVRVYFNTPSEVLDHRLKLSMPTGVGSDLLKIGGVKVFCDGALGARTAALTIPFADDPGNKGFFVHRRADLDRIVAEANAGDMQLAIHAIGDAGIDVAIKSIQRALNEHPRDDHRHRIEHLELPSRSQLTQMHKMNVIASMQPNFIGEWGGTDGMYVARLGWRRASRNNPFKEVLKAKVKLVFGSDCMPFGPLYGIHSAVNAPYSAQRLTAFDAIAAYTREAAFASFEERTKGTISVGKLADLAVLSADPLDNTNMISSIEVLATVLGGEVVFVKRSWRGFAQAAGS